MGARASVSGLAPIVHIYTVAGRCELGTEEVVHARAPFKGRPINSQAVRLDGIYGSAAFNLGFGARIEEVDSGIPEAASAER